MNKRIKTGQIGFLAALRQLAADKRRSVAVIASLACGIITLCLIGGYYEFTYWGLSQSLIRSQYGHIELYQKGYPETRISDPFAKPLERLNELLSLLRADPDIEVAAARALAFGTASAAETGRSNPVEVRGVHPVTETEIFTFVTSKRGAWLRPSDNDKCQLAPVLAESLGVSPSANPGEVLGSTITLSVADSENQFNAMDFSVKTLVGSYSQEFDALAFTITANAFHDLFGFDGAQEIALLLKDGIQPERKLAELKQLLTSAGFDLEYRLWYEQAAYFRQVLTYYQGFYNIVLLLAAILVFFVSGATIALSINERSREFGTRLTLGESRRRIIASLFGEVLLSGLAGLIVGGLSAFLLGFTINRSGGIPMPAAPGLTTALRIAIRYSPQAATLSILIAIIVPPAALLIPARRVAKASIIDLLAK